MANLMANSETKSNEKVFLNDSIIKTLRDSVQQLAYGTVTIKVNNHRIVQVEITENKRFDGVWLNEGGTGI
jgi:hypothetical protein